MESSALSRILTLSGCVVFVGSMTALHVIRRDIPPVNHGMSRYAGGGTLMLASVAFLALAASFAARAAGQSTEPQCAAWCLLAAAGLVVAVLSPIGYPSVTPAQAALHTMGGAAFYAGSAVAIWQSGDDPVSVWLRGMVLVALALFLAAGVRLVGLRQFVGVFQRVVFGIVIAWLVTRR
jgi:hypothetical protein